MADAQRCEYVVTPTTPRELASAIVRLRLTSVGFLVGVVAWVVLAVVFAVAGLLWLSALLVAVVLLLIGSLVRRQPKLVAAMRARGFEPGSRVSVDYGPDVFVVTTRAGAGTYAYAHVKALRTLGPVVVLRMRQANAVVVLPSALVPGDARRRLSPTAH